MELLESQKLMFSTFCGTESVKQNKKKIKNKFKRPKFLNKSLLKKF